MTQEWQKDAYLCCDCGTPSSVPALSCAQVRGVTGNICPNCSGTGCVGSGCQGPQCPGPGCKSSVGEMCTCTCPDCQRLPKCIAGCSPFDIGAPCCTKVNVTPQGNSYNPMWPPSSNGTLYNRVFKNAVPDAYSWQFDDSSSTFNCWDANYIITFKDAEFSTGGGFTMPPPPPPPQPQQTSTSSGPSILIWILIVVGIVVILGLIILVIVTSSNRKKKKGDAMMY